MATKVNQPQPFRLDPVTRMAVGAQYPGLLNYLDQEAVVIRQLYARTGGGVDLVSATQEQVESTESSAWYQVRDAGRKIDQLSAALSTVRRENRSLRQQVEQVLAAVQSEKRKSRALEEQVKQLYVLVESNG